MAAANQNGHRHRSADARKGDERHRTAPNGSRAAGCGWRVSRAKSPKRLSTYRTGTFGISSISGNVGKVAADGPPPAAQAELMAVTHLCILTSSRQLARVPLAKGNSTMLAVCARRTTRHRCALVVWTMLPLTVWSGMPSTACVCANGQFMLFCHRCLAGELRRPHSSCCSSGATPLNGQHSCCAGEDRSEDGSSSSGSRCTPVVNARFVRPASPIAPHDCRWDSCVDAATVQVALVPHEFTASGRLSVPVLPTRDMVIEHRALRI